MIFQSWFTSDIEPVQKWKHHKLAVFYCGRTTTYTTVDVFTVWGTFHMTTLIYYISSSQLHWLEDTGICWWSWCITRLSHTQGSTCCLQLTTMMTRKKDITTSIFMKHHKWHTLKKSHSTSGNTYLSFVDILLNNQSAVSHVPSCFKEMNHDHDHIFKM